MATDKWAMRKVRAAVLTALLVLACGVLAYRVLGPADTPDWAKPVDAKIVKVGVSPDRKTLWAETDTYYSASCSTPTVSIEKHTDQWRVKVHLDRTSEFCTAEMCLPQTTDTLPSGELAVPNGSGGVNPGCKIYAAYLDEPMPAGVTVVTE